MTRGTDAIRGLWNRIESRAIPLLLHDERLYVESTNIFMHLHACVCACVYVCGVCAVVMYVNKHAVVHK